VIERLGTSVETGIDIAQRNSRGHLDKNHADELLSALEMTGTLSSSIFGDESGK
jgi:hypothetical protein